MFIFLVYKCPLPSIWGKQGYYQQELTEPKQHCVMLSGGNWDVKMS